MNRFLIVPILMILFFSCSEEKIEPQVGQQQDSAKIPDQESWNSKVIMTEDGILRAILFSDHITVYEDQNIKLLDNVKIDFYNEQQQKTTTLTSNKGKVDDKTNNLYAIQNVVAISDSGDTLWTDELMWNNKRKKITTDKFVTIASKKERIEGYGFESDQHLRNYVIFNITFITQTKEVNK
ncbi:MAG: LPS export ABC transporter periplasmic protein LptC [bacterium]